MFSESTKTIFTQRRILEKHWARLWRSSAFYFANFKRALTRFYASIVIYQPKVNEAHRENLLCAQS